MIQIFNLKLAICPLSHLISTTFVDISDIGKVILDLDSSVCYLSDTSADLDAIHIKSEKFSEHPLQ